jgi:uncharacterized protein (DUF58 family)
VTRALLSPQTLARLERLVVLARRSPPPQKRRRPRPGRGIEPGGRRDYAPGDDTRLLDWAAYARLDRLLIKVTEALPEPRLDLLLDTSGSMGCGSPLPHERAALALAAVAACSLARGSRVHVWQGSGEHLELSRPGQLVRLLEFLARVAPAGPSRLRGVAERLAAAQRPRGAAALFGDALDPTELADAARRLLSAGYDPLVVSVSPAAEVPDDRAAAAVDAGWIELVDAETGARRRAPFAALSLEQARRRRAARQLALARELEPDGIPLETLAPEAPFEAVALGLLQRTPA